MIKELNRKSLTYGVPGIVIQLTGVISGDRLIALMGTALLMAGLAYYARAKGHSAWLCLLAFLGLIGIIVLGLLRDRHPAPPRG